jgi:hypothetical protein
LINSVKSFAAVYRPHIFVENTTDVFLPLLSSGTIGQTLLLASG